jgi:hypothetical protein
MEIFGSEHNDRADLAESPDIRGWRNLDGAQRTWKHPASTWQDAAQADGSSRKRRTKPMKIDV